MLILSESDVRRTIDISAAVDVVSEGCAQYAAGTTDTPLRTELPLPKRGAHTMFMPAHMPDLPAIGAKILGEFPDNTAIGIPAVIGAFVLLDYETGQVAAVMGASHLTNMRTAALTGVALRHFAPPASRVAALLGTGGLALEQVAVLDAVLSELTEVRVWGRRPERARAVADEVTERGVRATVKPLVSAEEAVRGADVIVTVTSAHQPILDDAWVSGHALVCAMGGNKPTMQELPSELVGRADTLVADARESILARAGDFVVPIQAGLADADRVWEIGDVVRGHRPGRQRDDELVIFKSCGFAAVDLAMARTVYERAAQAGFGVDVDLLA